MEQTKYDVFISYSRKDSAIALKIRTVLERNGLKTFMNVDDLTMGMDNAETITTAIQRCRAVFAILSESSANSQWWRNEIELAQKLNLPIVFIADNYNNYETLPYEFRQSNIVKYDKFINHAEDVINHVFPLSKNSCYYQPSPAVDARPCPSPSREYGEETKNACGRLKTKPWVFVIIVVITAIVVWIIIGTLIHRNNRTAKAAVADTTEYESPLVEDTPIVGTRYERRHDMESIYEERERLEKMRMSIIYDDRLSDDEKNEKLIIIEEREMQLREKELLLTTRDNRPIQDSTSQHNQQLGQDQYMIDSVQVIFMVIIIIITVLSIVLTVLLILSRKQANRLKTSLMIVSDSKAKATIGNQKVILEKGNISNIILPNGEQQMELNYTDYNGFNHINCFIGGSTQLQAERDALRATISVVSNKWKEKKFHILSFTYEDFDRKFVTEGQQHLYDDFIGNEADMAVFVIKGDVGDKTVREFDKAYETFKKLQKPSIIVYRDTNCSLGKTAEELKLKVESAQQYWIDYGTLNELKYHFQDILSSDLWSIYMDEFRTAH